ncbi:SufD family Fe-S cluster assembly protein [uncultured Erythrobacter sp.]|uniref:SufD family Fe-S cluster assembly protein n=1 Tax=uncultured Erythrobacter sp. TaxID=263913 RepID=UPI0026307F5E|nr:SufD family Fe-S cluster assembly protein [uncultured Erythrobacter sp.]
MSDTATLPTRRDEAWRYADLGAIAKLGTAGIAERQDITVAVGETKRICLIVGGEVPDVTRIRLIVGDGATGEVFATSAGDDYTRLEIEVRLGKGAHFEFGGVTIGGGDAVREFVTTTVHGEADATSNQTVRSVHWGQATGNFLGEIKVARDAQKTDAAQDFKGLLLEAGASANAVPQLEIFADDVKCAHGATVGQLDEAARFYMAARGLSPELAQRLLVQAFIGDAFVGLDDEVERERLLNVALSALESAKL